MSIDPLDRKPVQYASHSRHTVEGPGFLNDRASSRRHYRIADLAEIWGIGRETVRKIVKDEPGVSRFARSKEAHTSTAYLSLLRGESTPGCECRITVTMRRVTTAI